MNSNSKQQLNEVEVSEISKPILPPPPLLLTVKQFAKRNTAFSEAALRNIRFKSQPRYNSKGSVETNGAESVFVTIGRKILVDENAFYNWIRQQNSSAKKVNSGSRR